MKLTTRKMTFTAIMIALSAILSYIPIPGIPTTAFDSLPGYFTAIWVSPYIGGLVALIGHLFTALIHGFTMTLIGHIIIALSMFVAALAFGFIYKKGNIIRIVIAVLTATLINTYSSMPFLHLALKIPYDKLFAMQIVLIIASLANILLALLMKELLTSRGIKNNI